MNQEIKQKFITALNSGDYQQDISFGNLVTSNDSINYKYCALGVLGKITDVDLYSPNVYQQIRDKSGLTKIETAEIIRMNDLEELTFPQIAQEIQNF